MHVCRGKGGNCILQVSKSGVHVCRGGIFNFSRGYIRIHKGRILKWGYEFWGCSMAILRSSIFWGGGGGRRVVALLAGKGEELLLHHLY